MHAVLEEWRDLEQQWRLEKQKTLPGTDATAAATTSGSLELSLATPAASRTGHSTPATVTTSAEGASASTSRAMTPHGQRMMMPKASLLDLSKSLRSSRSAAPAAKGDNPDPAAAAAMPLSVGHVMVEVPVVDLGDGDVPSCQGQMLTVTPAAYLPPGSTSNRSTSSTAGAVSNRAVQIASTPCIALHTAADTPATCAISCNVCTGSIP
jgi:hypothetical protein